MTIAALLVFLAAFITFKIQISNPIEHPPINERCARLKRLRERKHRWFNIS